MLKQTQQNTRKTKHKRKQNKNTTTQQNAKECPTNVTQHTTQI
jgi:hypothetical protein